MCGFLPVLGKPYNVSKSYTVTARGGGCFFKDANFLSSLSKEISGGLALSSSASGKVGDEGAK